MSRLYGPLHRSLQDRFDTRGLADNTEARLVLSEIPPEHKTFIRKPRHVLPLDHRSRGSAHGFLQGRRSGFVRVLDSKTVAFPCYDGNGMFYSMGNLLGNQHVGMLFINFEKPHRLRLQGIASIDDNDPLLRDHPEAQLIVRVRVTEIFRNCPRYVHHYKKIEPSKVVPRSSGETPIAPWKKVEDIQALLPERDRARVQREGDVVSRAQYEKYVHEVIKREP